MRGMCYLTVSLLDEVTTVLDVKQQISIGMILNTDSLIDEQLRKHILHPKGHIQDVRHLRKKRRRRRRLYLDNPRVKMTCSHKIRITNKQEARDSNGNIQAANSYGAVALLDVFPILSAVLLFIPFIYRLLTQSEATSKALQSSSA